MACPVYALEEEEREGKGREGNKKLAKKLICPGLANPDEAKIDPDSAGTTLAGRTASPPTWHVRGQFLE